MLPNVSHVFENILDKIETHAEISSKKHVKNATNIWKHTVFGLRTETNVCQIIYIIYICILYIFYKVELDNFEAFFFFLGPRPRAFYTKEKLK